MSGCKIYLDSILTYRALLLCARSCLCCDMS